MYPAEATRLVPEVLQPFIGGVVISPAILRRMGLAAGTTLEAIGRTELDMLDDSEAEVLASIARKALQQALPRVRDSEIIVRITAVPEALARARLTRRAFNVAMRAQVLQLPWLTGLPLAGIASEEGMGAATLLEVLSLLEGSVAVEDAAGTTPRTRSKAVAQAAAVLSRRRWAPLVGRNDPRLVSILRDLAAFPGDSMKELGAALATSNYTPGEARRVAGRVAKLTEAGDALRKLTVEQEIGQLIDTVARSSTAARIALRHRLGVAGGEVATLEASGNAAGITRERVRQIEAVFLKEMRDARPWTPALDRAIADVQKHLPCPVDEIERSLDEGGMTEGASLSVLTSLERALGRSGERFKIDSERNLVFQSDLPMPEISAIAKRLATHWGVTTVDEVVAESSGIVGGYEPDVPTVRALVDAIGEFEWLDDEQSWFWARGASRNRLLHQIEKIMSVAGSIDIGELRDGVGRHHRTKGFRPPREVLARLCVATGLYGRDGDQITEGPELRSWAEVLSPTEQVLTEILFEHGPVMRRDDLERIACDERHVNRSSFYVYLTYLPFLARFAPGVYGLRGTRVSAAEVQALIPPRVFTQRLREHGWTPDRQLWMAYELPTASAHSGVLTVSSELRDVASGEFSLTTEDQRPVGTLVLRGQSMWGLSPFFRRSGVEEGDYVLLTLDLVARSATVAAGTDELLLRHQGGE